MIKCRIELGKVVFIGSCRYVDFGKISVPCITCIFTGHVEIEARHLGLHVIACPVIVNGRHTHLDQQLLTLFHRGETQQRLATCIGATLCIGNGIIDHCRGKGLRELGIKINLLVESPVFGHFPTAQLGIAHHFQSHVEIGLMLD